jgi:opacity protein-like surface antigen
MKRKFLAIGVVLFVGGVWVQAALALDTLGPPAAAGLDQGQSSLGLDYSHARMNLKLYNAKWSSSSGSGELPEWKMRNLTTDVVTANIGYGIAKDLEGFVRLGAMTTEDTKGTLGTGLVKYRGNPGFDFDFGFGAKATFWQQDNLKMGGIAQFSWSKPDGKASIDWGGESGIWKYSSKIEVREIQIAVGPTYEFSDGALIYGGPFVHYVDGSIEFKSSTYRYSADVIQQNYLGGFVGIRLDPDKYTPFINIEWQHTATDDALGLNLTWKY